MKLKFIWEVCMGGVSQTSATEEVNAKLALPV